MPDLRVLVVDDCQDTADSLAILLRLWGHAVSIAYDGPTALRLASAHQPHVILLDMGLPGMDGYTVARQLRQHTGDGRPQVIAITGYGDADHRLRGEAAGCDSYLVKPVDPAALEVILGKQKAGLAPQMRSSN